MSTTLAARTASARKSASVTPETPQVLAGRLVRRCPTLHLTMGQYIRLLACIDAAGGVITIDEISRALPRVAQPVSAIFDLCDAGILNVDWEAAFDGNMHVWRVDC